MKLGIFDSGIGGKAIANSLKKSFPDAVIEVVDDSKNVPYGDKLPDEIIALTNEAIQPLINGSCNIIVIACNTATAIAIDNLRKKYPNQKFIGIEPMIKSAADLTKTNHIAVFATSATLNSSRYKNLVEKYGEHLEITEPNCSDWAWMIEQNQINKQKIEQAIEMSCNSGADVIVLGCTHYHWIKELIIELVDGRSTVLEPSNAISQRVKELLDLS